MKFKLPSDFYSDIKEYMKNGASCMEALIEYSKDKNIELEIIASLVKRNEALKTLLLSECQELKLIKDA